MGETVNRLEEFKVANTGVTIGQITAILEKILEGGSKLNKLKLCDLDYGAFMAVEQTFVQKLKTSLESSMLSNLTT
jgi:hypothetical protein